MRQLKKCNLIQKTIASLAILLTLSTAIVIKPVYAVDIDTLMAESGPTDEEKNEGTKGLLGDTVGGVLFKPICWLAIRTWRRIQ